MFILDAMVSLHMNQYHRNIFPKTVSRIDHQIYLLSYRLDLLSIKYVLKNLIISKMYKSITEKILDFFRGLSRFKVCMKNIFL